ncbi:hypothetical protein ACHAW6_011570 [Cyclotella cf. meneghiniana]
MRLLLKSFKSKKKATEQNQAAQVQTVTRAKRFPKISVIIEETNGDLHERNTKKSSWSEPSITTEQVDICTEATPGLREHSIESTQEGTNVMDVSNDTSCFMDRVCIGSNHPTFKKESESDAPHIAVAVTEPEPESKTETSSCFMDQACIGSDDLMTAGETMTAGEAKSEWPSLDDERTQVSLVTAKSNDQGWLEEMKEEIIFFAKSKVASTTEYIRGTANVIDQLAGVKNGECRDDDPTLDGTSTIFDEASYFTGALSVRSYFSGDRSSGKATLEDDATYLTMDETLGSQVTRDRSFGTRTVDDDATYLTKDKSVRSYVSRERSFGTRTQDDEAPCLTTAGSYVTRDHSFGIQTLEDDATYLTRDKSVRSYVTRDSSVKTRTFEDDATCLTRDKSVRSRGTRESSIGIRKFGDESSYLSKEKSVRSRVSSSRSFGLSTFEDEATYLTKDKSVMSNVTRGEVSCHSKHDDITYVTRDHSYSNETASTYRTENHFAC